MPGALVAGVVVGQLVSSRVPEKAAWVATLTIATTGAITLLLANV